jgi:hypothetical protein
MVWRITGMTIYWQIPMNPIINQADSLLFGELQLFKWFGMNRLVWFKIIGY